MIPRASKIGGDAEGRDAGPVGMVGYVMTQSAKDVRAQLIDALVLDLVGPKVGNAASPAARGREPAPSRRESRECEG